MHSQYNDFKSFATKHAGISTLVFEDYEKAINMSAAKSKDIVSLTPNIVEERQMNMTVLDVFSRLMKERIIFLGTGIDDQVANIIVAQLLFLESVDAKKDIQMYILSGGGSVYSGLAIYDTMQYIAPKIGTTVIGMAASMAFVLACAGQKGMRSALKHAKLMQHQPLGGAQGQASDIEITAKQIIGIKKTLYEIISQHTGQEIETIYKDADRDCWMTAQEAKDYGVIDNVILPKEKL